jgi:hypothetical protein
MSKPIKISATTFANFCAAAGPARVGVVKQAKNIYGAPYEPSHDYWKPFRDELVAVLRDGRPISDLITYVNGGVHAKKTQNYRVAAAGAVKWIGKKKIVLATPAAQTWHSGSLEVRLRPEIVGTVNGEPHAIKLWLRANGKVTKSRVDPLLHLLGLKYEATVGVLDVSRSRLITPTRLVPGIDALLAGEASAFVEMWNLL